jgi:hypothetical protein
MELQHFKRKDLVCESVNPEIGRMKWKLIEITCPWPAIDYDGDPLEKAYRKKVGKYDFLRQELKKEYPQQEVEQATIVVLTAAVLHKKSQIEFAKATRLAKKDLARWQRNVVDIAIHGSYQVFHESIEKTKFNQKCPPTKEVLEILGEHVIDLIPDADEDSIHVELAPEEDITGIEEYQASVAVRELAILERRPLPALSEHPDGALGGPPSGDPPDV